jgi:hypothetical protein
MGMTLSGFGLGRTMNMNGSSSNKINYPLLIGSVQNRRMPGKKRRNENSLRRFQF